MKIAPAVSVVIPSRNEKFLQKTIDDLLLKAKGNIEIIAVLDGYWIDNPIGDPKVIYLHRGQPEGMRSAINSGVAIAKGEYILKTDAHCLFGEGFDEILKADYKDNWVVVPRRYALDVEKWEIEKRQDNKYPVDYMYLSRDLHGEPWPERRDDPKHKDLMIDDLMSAQGSCWFMKKSYFEELELEDEEVYGKFWNEFQEIGLKCWLSGGEVKVNKKTWYAHLHKTKGRGYSLENSEQEKALEAIKKWVNEDGTQVWHKQKYSFKWLLEKFWPVPGWPEDRSKWTL